MKHGKISWTAALIVGGAFLATSAPAMENHAGHDMSGAMNHGDMNHGDMQQMEGMEHGQGGMIVLGEEVQNGVKAMFHLMTIDPKVMPAGNKITHHLMVMFNDTATGKTIGSGTVAVKVESPEGKEAAPVKLMGMQGHFGADVNLDKPGIWHFRIATKLADGKVRQFHSHHVVK
jgi:hypothetical protein